MYLIYHCLFPPHPPIPPRPTTRADGGERKFNLSLPRSHLQERIRSPRLQNLPVIVRQGGKRKNHGGWVGKGGGGAEPGFLRYDSNQGCGKKEKSPTGRLRNKWHRAFGGAGNSFESFKQLRGCCSVNQD